MRSLFAIVQGMAAEVGNELPDNVTSEEFNDTVSDVVTSGLEKAAQLQRAQHYYFGNRRLTQMLAFASDPSYEGIDVKATTIQVVQNEFGIEDEEIGVLVTELDEVADMRNATALVAVTSRFLAHHVDVQTYERLLRRRFHESSDFAPLNEITSFHIRGEDVLLHLAPARTMTQAERSQQLLAGFSTLANQLVNDPELAATKSVKMVSLLVTAYRAMIEQWGFDVHEVEDEATLIAFSLPKGRLLEARMPRDAFIQRYA